MNIKFDFWVTPDGYTGANTENTGKAHHVKGAVDMPESVTLAAIASIILGRTGDLGFAIERAGKLINRAEAVRG